MSLVSTIALNSTSRLSAAGWVFFIGENAILSENRTWLIEEFGDDKYHLAYGLCSTLATASIGYSYFRIRNLSSMSPSLVLWKSTPSTPALAIGWAFLSVGLVMASQAAPRMQIPVAFENNAVQVKCPFDFSDKKFANSTDPRGAERISRHPGLWSLGFIGLGQAVMAPTVPLQVWWMGPAAVALIGGGHTDSRFRRGMGGMLPPEYDCQTSNIPFWAALSGKQGSHAWSTLAAELKPLNAGVAILASSLWVLRKVR